MYFQLISLSFMAYIQAFGGLKMFSLSSRVAIMLFRCWSICIPEFGPIYNKGGGPRIFKVTNFSNALLDYVRVFLKLLDLKISPEIHKERPLKISCHCDSELTTASYYSFSTPLAQNSGALRSPNAGPEKRSQRRSQTLCKAGGCSTEAPPATQQLPTRQARIPLGEDI